jgi:lipid-binding SYLF domain-containing protein
VPSSRDVAARSVAYLIFPNVTEAGFLVGGQYGSGVLFRGGQPIGYYNISAGSFGLQAGAQSFSQAYFFMTEDAFRVFEENKGMEMGAGVDFVVAQTSATGEFTTTMVEPVIVYVWGQAGLFGGAAVEGQKITERENE